MKKAFVMALLIGLCSWLSMAQAGVITLSGLVVTGTKSNDVGRGDPLDGVEIEVQGTDYRTRSSSTGYFSFADLPNGDYTLVCRKPGFPTVQQRVRVTYVGAASRCQVLMNPENATFVGDLAVKSGALYVAFSERLANENGLESSPYKMVHQQAVAAGAKIIPPAPDLPKMPRGPSEADEEGSANFQPAVVS